MALFRLLTLERRSWSCSGGSSEWSTAKGPKTLQTQGLQAAERTETGGAATASELARGRKESTEGTTALTRGTGGETVETETTRETGLTPAENAAIEPATGPKTATVANAVAVASDHTIGMERATDATAATTTTPKAIREGTRRTGATEEETETTVDLQKAATVAREQGLALNQGSINPTGRRMNEQIRLSRPENLSVLELIHSAHKITPNQRLKINFLDAICIRNSIILFRTGKQTE